MKTDIGFWKIVSSSWSVYSDSGKIKDAAVRDDVSDDGTSLNDWLDGADDELD